EAIGLRLQDANAIEVTLGEVLVGALRLADLHEAQVAAEGALAVARLLAQVRLLLEEARGGGEQPEGALALAELHGDAPGVERREAAEVPRARGLVRAHQLL